MKKLLFLLLIGFAASAQYTISPWNGSNSQTSCPSSNNYCSTTTFGNTVKLSGVFVSGSTTNFRFVLVKCDVSNFSTGGTFYLKSGSVCGNVVGTAAVSSGTNNSVITYSLTNVTSSTQFYGLFVSSNGANYHTNPITVTPPAPQPDLRITANSVNPTSVTKGSNTVLRYNLMNSGNGASGSFRIRYYLSTNTTYSSSDIELQYSSYYSGGLSANGSLNNESQTLNIPSNVNAGNYYIIPYIDADGQVNESSETNNTSFQFITVTEPPLPDLQVTNVSLSSQSVQVGTNVTVNYTFSNSGGAAGAFDTRFFLSTNSSYDATDEQLDIFSVNSYGGDGNTQYVSRTLTIPSNKTPGPYYILVVADLNNQVTESNTNNNRDFKFLNVNAAPSVSVSSPTASSTYQTNTNLPINWAFTGYSGNTSIELTQGSTSTVAYTVIANSITNPNSYNWTIPTNIPAGPYRVKVYNTGPANIIGYSGVFNIGVNANCPNCITGVTESSFTQTGNEGFCAAQYLCSNSVIIPTQPSPTAQITRGDLANITYRSVIGETNNTNALYFPNPFIDLQATDASNTEYYKHAKTLSYLDYGDARSPFDRNNVSFNPTGTISRILVLKVFLEAWNIDETNASSTPLYFNDISSLTNHELDYLKKAVQLGIITNGNPTTPIAFRPNDAATREETFLTLYRLITNVSITKPTLAQINAGLFVPGQYRPDNLSVGVGTDRGNFNHYTKTSFAIDGVVPLVFAHSYNSYTTELPMQLYPNFLGRGWTHSFNCYITATGSAGNERFVVHYPDGKLHYYKIVNGALVPESIGVYDVVTVSGSPVNLVTITTPSKIVYQFEKLTGQNGDFWLVKSIKDRNNNTLTFTNELGINNYVRLKSVQDPAGRKLNFVYKIGEPYNYLAEVNLSGVGAFNGRKVEFNYTTNAWDGDGIKDLASYKEYDKNGVLKTTSYSYYTSEGSEHLLKTITLPKGNIINNTYEQRKLKSSQTLNGSNVVQQMNTNWTPTYSTSGQTSTSVVSVVANGVTKTTNYGHNSNGLAETINSTGSNPVNLSMDYGLAADPTSVTNITQTHGSTSTGVRIEYYNTAPYNVKLVKTAKAPGDSITQSYVYNTFNDISSFTNGRGFTTSFNYNASGNLIQINHPLGSPTTMLRNSNGTISKVTTPANVVTNFTYNNYGNLLTTSTPNGSKPAITTSATYDALSRVTSKTDARNQTVTYDYFANDLLKKMNAPLNYYVEYNYDANDNNTTVTNAKGNATTNVFHPQTDQLTSRTFGSKTESFTYNEDGSLKTYTNGRNQVFTFTYDLSGRITNDSYAAYTYNEDGTLNTVVHTQGSKTYTLDYDYDALKRLNKTTCDGFIVQYHYDNNNNLDLLTYPDGKTVAYTYDQKDRISKVTDWAARTTTYTYDDDGKVLSCTLPNGTQTTYTYDVAGRRTGMTTKKSNNSTICSYTFALDQGGNHTEENIIEPFTNLPTLVNSTTNYTTDARNQTTVAGVNNYTFDGNGATTNQAGLAITWDSKDNLLTRNGVTYYYDGNETRRAKTGKRYVINELSNSVLVETNDAGTALYNYVYGPTGLLYRQSAAGVAEYYHYDFRGSTIAMTNASQTVVRQYQYDAFGKILQQTPSAATDDNPFRYVGQYGVQYEADNLYFMRARYYDPSTGKFLSEDPIWASNLFLYSGNNPINGLDPLGNYTLSEALTDLYYQTYYLAYASQVDGLSTKDELIEAGLEQFKVFFVEKILESYKTPTKYSETIVVAYSEFIEYDKTGNLRFKKDVTSESVVNVLNTFTIDSENLLIEMLITQFAGEEAAESIMNFISPVVGSVHQCVVEGWGYIFDLILGNQIQAGDCVLNRSLREP